MRTSDKKVLENLIQKFKVEGAISGIEPFGNGHINDTFKFVTTTEWKESLFILQRMNGEVFKNSQQLMANVMHVTEFLKEKINLLGGDASRETLQVIPTKTGEPYYQEQDGDGWRVYPLIKGTVSYDQAESPEMFKKSGYAFGNFQYLLSDYPAEQLYETIVKFHDTVDRFAKFRKAVDADIMGRAKEVQAEIQFIMERENDCHYFGDLFEKGEIPHRVTHNDTKLNNVLFDKKTGEAICVIDLDTVMPGFAAFDFGDAIRFGASTAAEDEKDLSKVSCSLELYQAYFEGFMEGCRGSLTAKEIETFPMGAKIMTLECGMRFLTDYLEGDVYFKTHYPEQNLDRTRTQLTLVKDMEDKWEQIEEIVRM